MSIKSRKHPLPQTGRSLPTLALAALATSLALTGTVRATDAAAGPDRHKAHKSDKAHKAHERRDAELEPIVVKGEVDPPYGAAEVSSPKFTRPLLDTTQTIQVIGADLFNEQAATTLTDALRNSAGVGTFYAGENGNTSTGDAVYLRGFDSSSSIFVDGARDLGVLSRDVFNTEQVEVSKGPAGSDTGRSAPTGAINMVTKRPNLDASNRVNLSVGDASRERITADFNQPLGSRNDTALRVNLMAQDHGVPGRDRVENKRWGVAPSLGFGLDGNTRVFLDLLHIEQDNVPDGGVSTIGLPGYTSPDPARPEIGSAPMVDPSNFYGTSADFDKVTVDMATVRIEHEFSDNLRLNNTLRWGRNQQNYLLTSFMTSNSDLHFVTPDINNPDTWLVARSLPTFKDQDNSIVTNHLNLSGQGTMGSSTHYFSIGTELTREEVENIGIDDIAGTSWPMANLYHPDADVSGLQWAADGTRSNGSVDTVALYAFDTIELNAHWQINGGVRVDDYRADFSSIVECGGRRGPDCGDLPTGSLMSGGDLEASDTLVNWKFGVLYKPGRNSSLYANLARSQQPPGGATLELSSRENSANNPGFDPQKAATAELGGKWQLNDGSLLLTAALFRTEVSNEVVRDPLDQQYYQTGEKRVQGIELSAVGRVSENLSLSAGFTRMDTEVVEGTAVAEDGSSQLTYTPGYAFTSWATWQVTPKLSLGGGARYIDGLKRGNDGAVGTPTETDGYALLDAVASYRVNPQLNLRLNINNVFDKDYVAAINKSGYRYTPGQPRNVQLSAEFSF